MSEPKGLLIRSREILLDEENETVQHITDIDSISPGDPVVYSVTHEVNYGNGEKMWVKLGASTQVRINETPLSARNRLVGYVHNQVALSIHEAVEHAKSI